MKQQLQPKLILIEGLPGFGKSTTAQLVYEILTEMGIEARLFLEGNLAHPADYDGVAFLEKVEYDALWNAHEQFRTLLSQYTSCQGNHYFVEFRRLLNEYGPGIPHEMMNAFVRNDVYELQLAQHRELITAKWRQCAEKALRGPDTYVFDCVFLQNPVTMGMIKNGAAEEYMTSYILELEAIIKPLNPLLIVVEQDDLEAAFRKAVCERPEEWSEGFIQYYTTQGYGLRQGHQGLEGTVQVLKGRRKLEERIYNLLSMHKTKVNNSAYDLQAYKRVLTEKLKEYF
ncbi:hypothetical protein [Paenibacillus piscarius]|uniref:hypothetical protein n=1 Tax=Paenibacillus piscarius TaxID=1089681 RepID=UPI001EE97FE4|nr:hypothetical protein [Paenibacillus piscarius]